MYIALTDQRGSSEGDALRAFTDAQDSCREAEGFRWSMLLRSTDNTARLASVAMWLSPEHQIAWRDANGSRIPTRRFDVSVARGSMTPATTVTLVEWHPEPAQAARFSARWNAAYHPIENIIGSRLLQDLESPSSYTGLHAVTDAGSLDSRTLSAELTDEEGLSITPTAVDRFEVILLTEAS